MIEKIVILAKKTVEILSKKIFLPGQEKLEKIMSSFSSSERFLFWFLIVVISFSSIFFLSKINSEFTIEVPRSGGKITEGVVGSPRFINPLLARSKADKGLVSLVYSGLTKMDPNKGIVPDLAKSWSVSEDKLTYTFKIKEGASFHDEKEVTADDVIFTINKTKSAALESPKRANWDGIKVEKIDNKTVAFTLKQEYSPFIKNTTIGILPKHIWGEIPSKQFSFSRFNIDPVGSGPFKVSKVNRDSSGIPKSYELEPFKKFQGGSPYLKKVIIFFYPSQEKLVEGYNKGEIEQFHSISAQKTQSAINKNLKIVNAPLPRVFSLFYNKNKADIFTSYTMRKAIDKAINKKEIIDKVFSGYADKIEKPMPYWMLKEKEPIKKPIKERIANSKEKISSMKWKFDEERDLFKKGSGEEEKILGFSITTSNTPELKETAELIKKQLKKIGVKVEIKIFEESDLNQNAIRPRDYETLLFGEVIGPGVDLYPFWHSSKQNDPGINMAMYANIKVDNLLKKARKELDKDKRIEIQKKIAHKISSEVPASFLYTPHFTYVLGDKVKGASISGITSQKDRFMNIADWYIKTEKIWKIFAKNK